VLRVGRKFYHVSSRGAPIRCAIDNSAGWNKTALLVDVAKREARRNFGGSDEWRTPKAIDQVISEM
jgi:hypothetical protein